MKEAEEFCPKNKEEWRNWLKRNHVDKNAVWLIFYRKTSPKYNLSWSESVDESLCFGWIDSTKKTIDNEKYKQYFTKRKAKSNWSKVNKEKIQKLIDNGLMAEAGLASIKIAKENGSWAFLDAIENLEIPNDLLLEFSKNEGTLEYFESLSKSDKKSILYWVISAKGEKTRQKRILEIVENALQKNKPKQFR